MKKFICLMLALIMVFGLLIAQRVYIINNLDPYIGERGQVLIEFEGQVYEYYAAPVSELEFSER